MSTSKGKTKRKDPLPTHFESPEAAGQFWDAHDSADYENLVRDMECEIDVKRRTFLVPLDRDLLQKVRSIARKKGVSAAALLNMWIQEKAS